ncbi:hypothetical protein SNE40_005454 [Patella caerulea]|uniref:Uncharacterized protein n=2 Tax=Patella caerulea TaxID=87958 RepID=A0AAN8Q4N8_PATCE
MKTHVSMVCKKANFHLYNIGKIRSYIDLDTTKMLINAFVMSSLDYCNSLLYSLPKTLVCQLQKIQNKAARIVSLTRAADHITPVLKQLHWLPVNQRIMFKINTITFNCLNDPLAPSYLSDLIKQYVPSRSLRSSHKNQLVCPVQKSKFGERAFVYAAPKEWNKLPLEVQNSPNLAVFKRRLKTLFFTQTFEQ